MTSKNNRSFVGARLAARIIDTVILTIPSFVAILAVPTEYPVVLAFILIGIVAGISILQLYMLTVLGQTIGKKLLGVRIYDQKTKKVGGFVQNVLLRSFVNNIISIVPFYALVDVCFIFRQDQRCIHDHIASTVVGHESDNQPSSKPNWWIPISLIIFAIALSSVVFAIDGTSEEHKKEWFDMTTYTFDFIETRSDYEFVKILIDAKSGDEVNKAWKGLDKKQKQQAWYVKEDVEALMKLCKEEGRECITEKEMKELGRAADTAVKAFETEDAQESNRLAELSVELANDVLTGLFAPQRLYDYGEDHITEIVDRYFEYAIADSLKMREACDDVKSGFHYVVRYKTHCTADLLEFIKEVSSQGDGDYLDNELIKSSCDIERYALGTYEEEDMEEMCPHTFEKTKELKKLHDAYLKEHDKK